MTGQRYLVFLLAVLMTGCGTLSAPPRDKFYRLQVAAAAAPAASLSPTEVVFVAPFRASGLHGERALIYGHDDGTSLEQYTYHFWIDSPRRLLQHELADYLEGALGVRVVREPVRDARRAINGRIVRLERIAGSGAGQAAVALQFDVERRSGEVPELSRSYQRVIELSDDSVAALVAGINTATAEIFAQFAADLSALE